MKVLNRTGPSIEPLGYAVCHWPPNRFCVADHNPLSLISQSVSNPPHCLLIQPVHQQFVYEDVMGYSVKGLTDVPAENDHCSLLSYQDSHFVVVYQVDQA